MEHTYKKYIIPFKDIYWKTQDQYKYCVEFAKMCTKLGIKPWQPNPKTSPWLWQFRFDLEGGGLLVHFWPHKNKFQFDGRYAVIGLQTFEAELGHAIRDAYETYERSATTGEDS